jgi:hypothetical protein
MFRAEDISALAWVDCGVLTVASGNQIRCYLKWLTQEDKLGQCKFYCIILDILLSLTIKIHIFSGGTIK